MLSRNCWDLEMHFRDQKPTAPCILSPHHAFKPPLASGCGRWLGSPPVDTLIPFFSSSAQVFSTWVLPFKLDSLRTWGEERKSSREFSTSTGPQPWWGWRHFPSKSYELQHTPHPRHSLCHSTLLFRPLVAKYHPEIGLDLCLLSYEKFHWKSARHVHALLSAAFVLGGNTAHVPCKAENMCSLTLYGRVCRLLH